MDPNNLQTSKNLETDSNTAFNNYNSMMTAFLSSTAAAAAVNNNTSNLPISSANQSMLNQSKICKRYSFNLSAEMSSPSASNLNSIGSANSNASSSSADDVNSSIGASSNASAYMPVPSSRAACTAAAHLLEQLQNGGKESASMSQCLPQQPRAPATVPTATTGYEVAFNMIGSPCPVSAQANNLSSGDELFSNTYFNRLSDSDFGANPLGSSMGVSQANYQHQQQTMFPASFAQPQVSNQQYQAAYAAATVVAANVTQARQFSASQHHGNINPIASVGSSDLNETTPKKYSRTTATTSVTSKKAEYVDKSLPQMPRCSICKADSTGIHFGAEACAACSAFFRRTVVLNKKYGCSKEGQCNFHKNDPNGQKCRACRFTKCLAVGMDRNSVQHRRDAIGKYSTLVKRECSSPIIECSPSTSLDPSPSQQKSPMTPKSPWLSHPISSPIETIESVQPKRSVISTLLQNPSVLEEVADRYDEMNRRRKVFYSKSSLSSLFDESVDLEPSELTDFGECMYQFWRVEPKLAVEFIASNKYFKEISKDEKKIGQEYAEPEEPYITWKHGGLTEGKEFWMMPNRIYMVFNHAEQYFDRNSSIMKDLNLDKTSAVNLFKPSFEHAMEVVGRKMADMNLTKTEMIALVGIVLFDSTCSSLVPETKVILNNLKNQLFKDMINHYEADDSIDYPEIRLGNLILLMTGIKIHAQKSRENMHLLKIFDVVPRDELFDDVTGCN